MTIQSIRNFAENTAKFNPNKALQRIFDSTLNKARILGAVKAKLFHEGRAKDGRPLRTDKGRPVYAPYTVGIKRATKLPYKHVTLYQTGWFYASFKAQITETEVGIHHSGRAVNARIYDNFTRFAANENEFFEQALGLPRDHLAEAMRPPRGIDVRGGIERIARREALVVT